MCISHLFPLFYLISIYLLKDLNNMMKSGLSGIVCNCMVLCISRYKINFKTHFSHYCFFYLNPLAIRVISKKKAPSLGDGEIKILNKNHRTTVITSQLPHVGFELTSQRLKYNIKYRYTNVSYPLGPRGQKHI